MNRKEAELTKRQKDLYAFLLTDETRWFTQKEICENVEGYNYIDDPRNHCADINMDRIAINDLPSAEKYITTKQHLFKIATREEFKAEIRSHWVRLISQRRQIDAAKRKAKRNGQMSIFDEIKNELRETGFYKTYAKKGNK